MPQATQSPGQGWRTCGLTHSLLISWQLRGPSRISSGLSLQKIQTTSVIYGGRKTKNGSSNNKPSSSNKKPLKDNSVVKSTGYSCRGPKFNSYPHMAAQNCSSSCRGLCRCIHTHIRMQAKYPTHNKK